jgi:hypothetical protein
MRFNQELILRVMKYFREKYDLEISPATAEDYLDSLADLYETGLEFAKLP